MSSLGNGQMDGMIVGAKQSPFGLLTGYQISSRLLRPDLTGSDTFRDDYINWAKHLGGNRASCSKFKGQMLGPYIGVANNITVSMAEAAQ